MLLGLFGETHLVCYMSTALLGERANMAANKFAPMERKDYMISGHLSQVKKYKCSTSGWKLFAGRLRET